MYTPEHYKMKDHEEIFEFIHKNSFAILITNNGGKINATHLPLLLRSGEGEQGYLYGHVAKANEQWKDPDEEVLVIFSGAHKYISSSWYESNQSVPTWNYLSVHVYGKIKILEDRESKLEIIKDVVKYFEGENSLYNVDDLKPAYFEGLIRGIVGFKIEIGKIEGKKKISQNHTEERQHRIITELEKFNDGNSIQISEEMKKNIEMKHDAKK
ncbi:MAG: FMN-binding negative transcriptional regulator [bacterium]|nr:FMN-binding negative transcriptional regulator [bacterium]